MTARLTHEGALGESHALRYLNRLSDLVFILARYLEAKQVATTRQPHVDIRNAPLFW